MMDFRPYHRKKMVFDPCLTPTHASHFSRKYNTYTQHMASHEPKMLNVNGDMKFVSDRSSTPEVNILESSIMKGVEHFKEFDSKKVPLCYSMSLFVVGGFVGSKSQVGGSHRGPDFIWDAIRKSLPNLDVKEYYKGPEKDNNYKQYSKIKTDNIRKNTGNIPVMKTKLNKSYAEVTKGNMGSLSSEKKGNVCNQQALSSLHIGSDGVDCENLLVKEVFRSHPVECPVYSRNIYPFSETDCASNLETNAETSNYRVRMCIENRSSSSESESSITHPIEHPVNCSSSWSSSPESNYISNLKPSAGISSHRNAMRLSSRSSSSESESTVSNDSLSEKNRTLSECSVDSDDSFIVFENNENDPKSSDDSSDDDDSSDEEDEDSDEVDCYPTASFSARTSSNTERTSLGLTEPLSPSNLDAVNLKWNNFYPSLPLKEVTSSKKVSFANGKELTKVQRIIVWDFAHRCARVGPWEQMARDSARFRDRIERIEKILNPVLKADHRQNIYCQRFASPENIE